VWPALSGAADALFPQPLHLVRTLEDSLAGGEPLVIEEYCSGNRVITVIGNRVTIADYDRQQLTEIDRAASTYSITPFEDIARARTSSAERTPAARATKALAARPLGIQTTTSGRDVDTYEVRSEEGSVQTTARIGFDRQLRLSRAAIDVLTGGAYPNTPTPVHAMILAASGGVSAGKMPQATTSAEALVAFPSDQAITYTTGGESVTLHSTVVRVSADLPPPEVLAIPPGARLVESKITAVPRIHDELDGKAPVTPRP
jgi:hypothetical protein